jgi:hypothetical protein
MVGFAILHTSFWHQNYLADHITVATRLPTVVACIIASFNHRVRDRGTERQELGYARQLIGMCNTNHHCKENGCRVGRVQHVDQQECEFIHDPHVICVTCEAADCEAGSDGSSDCGF